MYRFLGEQVPSRPLAIARIGLALAVILELPNTAKALLLLDERDRLAWLRAAVEEGDEYRGVNGGKADVEAHWRGRS